MSQDTLLEVKNLRTSFSTENGRVQVLDDVSFSIRKGKTLGIVGESGCGKSVTSMSIMRLLPKPHGRIDSGEIFFDGVDLTKLPLEKMYQYRGGKISMIFQEPLTALNPVQKIEVQLRECFEIHAKNLSSQEISQKCLQLLKDVGIPMPEARLKEYPHQLSGGMRQRIVIAIALAMKPELIIADEPTTALDVTIQAQILKLLKKLQKDIGTSLMFITHDLGVIAKIADDVAVMYCGQVVEQGSVHDIFNNPKHPYTKGLLSSIPRMSGEGKILLKTIDGMVPSLTNLPRGCRFSERCAYSRESCINEPIELVDLGEDGQVRCPHYKNLT